jgi:hypothetical protein
LQAQACDQISGSRVQDSKTRDKYFPDQQNIGREGGKAIGANDAVVGRPWEHQDSEQRHEFVGPDEAGDSEGQTELRDQTQAQIIHGVNFGGERDFTKNRRQV